jgi:hypothetical protein
MFKLFYNYILFFCKNVIKIEVYNEILLLLLLLLLLLGLHGNGFQFVVIGGAGLVLLFKPEAVVRLVAEVEVGFIVLRGINGDHALNGERNVDVKHANRETDDERRP